MTPSKAAALVKVARIYQDSLWLAESDPALAWILMVSAVEAAAANWSQQTLSPVERLKDSKPKLVDLLEKTGIVDLATKVADQIAETIGATSKFVEFILKHFPEPPPDRPPPATCVLWDTQSFKPILRKIYDYRSKALHAGKRFPDPMCRPPFRLTDSSAFTERPMGATSVGGAYWMEEDTPLTLHTFEYLVRNALLKWWSLLD